MSKCVHRSLNFVSQAKQLQFKCSFYQPTRYVYTHSSVYTALADEQTSIFTQLEDVVNYFGC